MFEIQIDNNKAWVTKRETLTVYSEGYTAVQIRAWFGPEWENLAKIAVFRAYDAQIDIAMTEDTVEIPLQVLLKPNVHLQLGIYGISASGAVVIPTVWADLGIIQAGANPTAADNYAKPAMDLYAQVAALAAAAQSAAATAVSGTYAGSVTFDVDDDGHLIMSVTEDGETTETDLGAVSAYAAAVDAGYTGTYAQFKALLIANAQTAYNVAAALAAVEDVTSTAASAVTTAQSAQSTANTASSTATAAATAAAAAQTAVAGKQAKHKKGTVTLTSGQSSWENVAVTPAVTGETVVTTTNTVFYGPAPASVDAYAEAGVRMTAQTGNNSVSFSATNSTTEDITINIVAFD